MTPRSGEKHFRRRALNLIVAAILSTGLLRFARTYGPRGGQPGATDTRSNDRATGVPARENSTETHHLLKTSQPGSGLTVIGAGCESARLAEYFSGLEKQYRGQGYVLYSKGKRSVPGARYYMLSARAGIEMLWAFDRSSSSVPKYTFIVGREEAPCKTRWDAYEVTAQKKTAAALRPEALVFPLASAEGLPVPPGARQTLGVAGVAGTGVFAFEVGQTPSTVLTWYRDQKHHNWNIQALASQDAAKQEPDWIYLTRSGEYCIVMVQEIKFTANTTVYLTMGRG